jgi:hypothetical protein
MNQQPDKLFREKLAGYQRPVPAQAWEKIAVTQINNSKKGTWTKIAASLSLLAIAAYLLWPMPGKVEIQNITMAEVGKEHLNVIAPPRPEQGQHFPEEGAGERKPLVSHGKPSSRNTTTKTNQFKKASPKREPNKKFDDTFPMHDNTTEVFDNTAVAMQLPETVVAESVHVGTPAIQNITLMFTAQEVNRYLDKKMLAQATSHDKKSSSFMKLLKKASNLKNNQNPLGELRQKKNEILALNFKSEKQHGQNK